jgi:hypothetical protein
MKKLLLLISLLGLTACQMASLVSTLHEGDKSIAIVKFTGIESNPGGAKLRQKAIGIAKETCKGKVKLLSEGAQMDVVGSSSYQQAGTGYSSTGIDTQQNTYLKFECLDQHPTEQIY